MGWVREPLDDAAHGCRQAIAPPAAASPADPADPAEALAYLTAAEINEAAGPNQFADGKS
jgi:hypothetical protein